MRKIKKLVLILLVASILIFAGYYYLIHGGERDLKSEKAMFTVTSTSISDEFSSNVDVANKKYLEKAVAISGVVTAVSSDEIVIDKNIICSFKTKHQAIQTNQKITVKGRIVGFDDLMGDLKVDECSVIE